MWYLTFKFPVQLLSWGFFRDFHGGGFSHNHELRAFEFEPGRVIVDAEYQNTKKVYLIVAERVDD